MGQNESTTIRNLALIGHGGTGKTSLAEALLHRAGVTPRLGRVDDHTSILDHDPDSQKRLTTLSLGFAPFTLGGCRVNLIDTPGYLDFIGEVHAALRVVESVVVVVDAAAGVEVGTHIGWSAADSHGLPRMVFVNRMDRENADFARTLQSLRSAFGEALLPVAWPVGAAASFEGVVDVRDGQCHRAAGGRRGGSGGHGGSREGEWGEAPGDAPEGLPDLSAWRLRLVEAAAEADDALLERYLEEGELGGDDLRRGLSLAVAAGSVVPVFCGSAQRGVGLDLLLEAIRDLAPKPDVRALEKVGGPSGAAAASTFTGLVFKTVADPYVGKISVVRVYSGTLSPDSRVRNSSRGHEERLGPLFRLRGKEQEPVAAARAGDIVAVAKLADTLTGDTLCDPSAPVVLPAIEFPHPVYPVAVRPKARGDEEKIGAGLARLGEEDPTFLVERDAEMHQMVLSAMGETHVEVIRERLHQKFGVEVEMEPPRVPYRETIRRPGKGEGRHKKQTGGHGQYGHCILQIEPLERGGGFVFEDRIYGGAVPKQYIPAVEKGVVETMREGVLAGCPVVDVRVILLDGSYHTVDSSELAFKIAASLAFKKAFAEAGGFLLEPIQELSILVPEDVVGDVMSDLNRKRGRITAVEGGGGFQRLTAHVPQAEANRYAIDLRSITQGRGVFSARFSHYEEAPAQVAQAVVAAHGVAAAGDG